MTSAKLYARLQRLRLPATVGGRLPGGELNILENFDLAKRKRYGAETLHLLAEAMRGAYCDRARHLGDPDFVKIPAHLTSKGYAKRLAAGIDPRRATRSEDIAPGKRMLSSQTPTIVARDGRVVLITGSPGSRTIINTVLCVIVNVIDFHRFACSLLRCLASADSCSARVLPSGFSGTVTPPVPMASPWM